MAKKNSLVESLPIEKVTTDQHFASILKLLKDLATDNSGKLKLPDKLKETIKNNVIELRESLKREPEFCEDLIRLIVNTGKSVIPSAIDRFAEEYLRERFNKELPPEVKKVPQIATYLSYLIEGFFLLTASGIEVDTKNKDDSIILNTELRQMYQDLGELVRKEINIQFNPDVNYKTSPDIEEMFNEAYEVAMAGQNFEEDL